MKVVILAAGYGTRLYPLTINTPKPLLLVNNEPIINFLIRKIEVLKKYFSIEKIKIVTNNKFYQQFEEWKEKYKINAVILNDGSNTPEERRGAIRAIKFAIEDDDGGDWLVMGGDNLFEDDLVGFVDYSFKHKPYPCVGIYDVKKKELATRLGVVKLNYRKRIIELVEKPPQPATTLSATCIYFFPHQSLRFLDTFLACHTHTDASGKYIEWLIKKTKVYGYLLKGEWVDIGHKDSLQEAEKKFFLERGEK